MADMIGESEHPERSGSVTCKRPFFNAVKKVQHATHGSNGNVVTARIMKEESKSGTLVRSTRSLQSERLSRIHQQAPYKSEHARRRRRGSARACAHLMCLLKAPASLNMLPPPNTWERTEISRESQAAKKTHQNTTNLFPRTRNLQ